MQSLFLLPSPKRGFKYTQLLELKDPFAMVYVFTNLFSQSKKARSGEWFAKNCINEHELILPQIAWINTEMTREDTRAEELIKKINYPWSNRYIVTWRHELLRSAIVL